jgi:hypothetical protein
MFKIGITEIEDKFNPTKIWLIKRTKSRHYFINQRNGDNLLNKRFIRCTLSRIKDILN